MKDYKNICIFILVNTVSSFFSGCAPSEDPLLLEKIDIPTEKKQPADGAVYSTGDDIFLFGSSRAYRVGDLLTVHVYENNDAKDLSLSKTNRGSNMKKSAGGSYNQNKIEGELDFDDKNTFNGVGNSHQNNKITGDITVMVTKVLPNNNLVVSGYKTITLNNGSEKIGVSGIVKESDIQPTDNSVVSNQIANAHIAYIGSGDLKRSSSKNWLQRILSIFSPF